MNILEEIVAHKRREVEQSKQNASEKQLEQSQFFLRPALSLKRHLLEPGGTGIIAEYKRKSPSKGIINNKADVLDVTMAYANNGAAGLSVLTDEHFFGGTSEDLVKARINTIPILRKEFIIDDYQITEAKAIGADAILLIAAILTPEQVKEFTLKAHVLGLEVLLEIHNETELDHIYERVDIVGVNNRDLKTFTVDLEQSVRLSREIPEDKIKISESGINDVANIQYLKQFGYRGFLIGENFMKENDPAVAFMKFTAELNAQQP